MCVGKHDRGNGQAFCAGGRHRHQRAADRAEPGGIDDHERQPEITGEIDDKRLVADWRKKATRTLDDHDVTRGAPRLDAASQQPLVHAPPFGSRGPWRRVLDTAYPSPQDLHAVRRAEDIDGAPAASGPLYRVQARSVVALFVRVPPALT